MSARKLSAAFYSKKHVSRRKATWWLLEQRQEACKSKKEIEGAMKG
jgi:hypothetical protein